MNSVILTACVIVSILVIGCTAQGQPFAYEQQPGSLQGSLAGASQQGSAFTGNNQGSLFNVNQFRPDLNGNQNLLLRPTIVPDCPLEIHPDTETMFIMRSPLGDPEPRTCPPGTYFLRSVCSCVNRPLDSKECNLRPSALGSGWYEENVFGVWVQRPCGPGSAYNPTTCDCSLTM